MVQPPWKTSWGFFKKLSEESPCPLLVKPVAPLLGISPKKIENGDADRHLYTMLMAALRQ